MRVPGPRSATGLRAALDSSGATDLFDCLRPAPPPDYLLGCLPRLGPPAQAVVELLGLGRSVPVEALGSAGLGRLVDALDEFGVLRARGGLVDLDGLSLYRIAGMWMFADCPRPSPTLYFGEDSLALARRIPVVTSGHALDLCAGPGAQALVMAARGYSVHAVDVNPVASELNRTNAVLNGLTSRIDPRTGDLYRVPGLDHRYDLIVANPPLLPIPAGTPYPFVGDGGTTGLEVAKRVIAGARDRLSVGGQVLLVCAVRADLHGPTDLPVIAESAARGGLDMIVTVVQGYAVASDSTWVRTVAATSAAHTGVDRADDGTAAEDLARRYEQSGVREIATVLFRGSPGTGRVAVQDLRDPTTDPPQPWLL
ncbi:class I SAM-dependent methyltransferase [Cellulomonas sp. IC4_254]|uniref:methyltransferase n=1 Tax=Cellulomonas sp. IC4_254 TaxID=2714040 RepID=UPI00142401F0|nr:class I SAM-dependent methyltransferase [Cellulomonas sp. IC4_254]NHT17714.1 class I SAM-dependent methyltransferase [Cellulomonas sp. IC4_254]